MALQMGNPAEASHNQDYIEFIKLDGAILLHRDKSGTYAEIEPRFEPDG